MANYMNNIARPGIFDNPNYWATFSCPAEWGSKYVTGVMPQETSLSLSSQFTSTDQTVGSNSEFGKNLADIMVGGVQTKIGSVPMWQGTSPIEFSLTLMFDAENNAKADVAANIVMLAALALPIAAYDNTAGGVMIGGWETQSMWGAHEKFMSGAVGKTAQAAEGVAGLVSPEVVGAIKSGEGLVQDAASAIMGGLQSYRVGLQLGNYLRFDSVLVKGANIQLENRLTKEGYPIAGQVDLTIQTLTPYTRDDLREAFGIDRNGYHGLENTLSGSLINSINGYVQAHSKNQVTKAISQAGANAVNNTPGKQPPNSSKPSSPKTAGKGK